MYSMLRDACLGHAASPIRTCARWLKSGRRVVVGVGRVETRGVRARCSIREGPSVGGESEVNRGPQGPPRQGAGYAGSRDQSTLLSVCVASARV